MTLHALYNQCARAFRHLHTHLGATLTIGAFVLLAGHYVAETPPFEMPEEPWHLRRMATAVGKALPPGHAGWLQSPPVPQVEVQPPLYYWLGGALLAPFNLASDPSVYQVHSYARFAELEDASNRNAMLAVRPTEPGEPLAVAIAVLRLFSVGVTAAGLAYAYLSVLRLLRGRRSLAVPALVLTGFLAGFVYLSSRIGPDPLGLALLFATVHLVMRVVDEPTCSPRLCWAAAITAGLTALTVWWGWMAIAVVLIGQYVRAVQSKDTPRPTGTPAALALMVAMGLVWPLQRLIRGSGEAYAVIWSRVVEMGLRQRLDLAAKAYWGLFGWLNIPVHTVYYAVISILLILGISGLVLRLIQWYWNSPTRTTFAYAVRSRIHPWQVIGGAWALLGLFVAMLHLLSPRSAFIGTTLLPLAPLVSMILVLGLDTWLRRTYGAVWLGAVALAFLVVSLIAPTRYIAPAYEAPPRMTLDQVPGDLQTLDVIYGEDLFLLGYTLPEQSVTQGEALALRLYWLARRQMAADHAAHITISMPGDDLVSSLFTFVGGGILRTSMWLPGDVVAQDVLLPVDVDAPAPGTGVIELVVLAASTDVAVPPVDVQGRDLGGVLPVTRVRIAPSEAPRYRPEQPLDASLEGQVTLMGYSVTPTSPEPGRTLSVVLYWRAEGPLVRDYTVFVHILNDGGHLIGQLDSQPLQGSYPTSFWTEGEQIRDEYRFTLPMVLAPGHYTLQVGMYDLNTGERLTIAGADPLLTHVVIGTIAIN